LKWRFKLTDVSNVIFLCVLSAFVPSLVDTHFSEVSMHPMINSVGLLNINFDLVMPVATVRPATVIHVFAEYRAIEFRIKPILANIPLDNYINQLAS